MSGAGPDYLAAKAEAVRRRSQADALTDADEAGRREGAAAAAAVPPFGEAGACAISVLTDVQDFGGDLTDLQAAARSSGLPVLRKDFMVDERALLEARLAGASAALLIVRILKDQELRTLLAAAKDAGLECLVEIHDIEELERAVAAGASLLGINNRDLQTLHCGLEVTERLGPAVPEGVTLVAESGIRSPADVGRMRDAGAHAVLVGESLLRLAPDERLDLARAMAGVRR